MIGFIVFGNGLGGRLPQSGHLIGQSHGDLAMIIQGRNDTRTPARQVEVYAEKLQELGKPLEIHWYDAGHSGGGVERDIEDAEIMLRFAYRVLRGGGQGMASRSE